MNGAPIADLKLFGDLRISADDNDVLTVNCSNGEVKCCKSTLIERSEYARALLSGFFRERNENIMNLPHATTEIFLKVLSFYNRKNENSSATRISSLDEAWEMLEVSDMMSLAKCAQACDDFICSAITTSNAEECYWLASVYNRTQVMKTAVRELAMATNVRISVISSAMPGVGAWVDKKRRDSQRSTMSSDACLFSVNDSVDNMVGFQRPKNDTPYQVQSKYNEVVKNSECSKRANSDESSPTFVRAETVTELDDYEFTHTFYAVGGYSYQALTKCYRLNADDTIRFVEKTDIFEDSDNDSNEEYPEDCLTLEKELDDKRVENLKVVSVEVEPFPDGTIEDYRVSTVETNIYITGGYCYAGSVPSSATWRYCTRKDKWERVKDMKHKRMMHCAAVVGISIYVCGGYDGECVHSSTESYDSKKDVWIEQPKMPIGVGNAACTSLRQSVYVFCGQFGSKSIHTTSQVQEFNTANRQWSLVTEYVSPVFRPLTEYGMNCGVIGDEILVVGGQSVRVDCYNTVTKRWRRLEDMNKRRIDSYVLTFRGRLLVAGGYDYSIGSFYNTIEVYDPITNTWNTLTARLPAHSKNCGFCYVLDVKRR